MVAVEAAAYGVPTVAFATGGVADAVADGQSGRLIPTGDYAAFAESVAVTLVQRETLRASCIEFAGRFAWPKFGMGIAEQLASVGKIQRASDSPS
jgi:phosphatidylinositol alpha-1,6-mannosyltransferase